MKTGIELIAEERQRQITQEGWTPEHDDQHGEGALMVAARAYLVCAEYQGRNHPSARTLGTFIWPWENESFKPGWSQLKSLTKAGALIAAEIDRLNRLPQP